MLTYTRSLFFGVTSKHSTQGKLQALQC